MTVSVRYAAEHLEELLSAVDGGESVEIERPERPAVRLSAVAKAAEGVNVAGKRILGAGKGELRVPSEEEWEAMDKEWRKSFADKFELDQV
jgi:antitoxin (DNA-binding transcriptional repressor) of toxin-antitoxin stability system